MCRTPSLPLTEQRSLMLTKQHWKLLTPSFDQKVASFIPLEEGLEELLHVKVANLATLLEGHNWWYKQGHPGILGWWRLLSPVSFCSANIDMTMHHSFGQPANISKVLYQSHLRWLWLSDVVHYLAESSHCKDGELWLLSDAHGQQHQYWELLSSPKCAKKTYPILLHHRHRTLDSYCDLLLVSEWLTQSGYCSLSVSSHTVFLSTELLLTVLQVFVFCTILSNLAVLCENPNRSAVSDSNQPVWHQVNVTSLTEQQRRNPGFFLYSFRTWILKACVCIYFSAGVQPVMKPPQICNLWLL